MFVNFVDIRFKLICMANCLFTHKDFLAPLMYQPLEKCIFVWKFFSLRGLAVNISVTTLGFTDIHSSIAYLIEYVNTYFF